MSGLRVSAPDGRWWWADAATGCVWPCDVLGPGVFPGYVRIRVTLGEHEGETMVVGRRAVYDGSFSHPEFQAV